MQDQNSGLVITLRKSGKTLREICAVLNESGITTSNGGMFYPSQVHASLSVQRCPHEVLLPGTSLGGWRFSIPGSAPDA